MYKYENIEFTKLQSTPHINKRAAEATRRPTVKQLRSDEIISLALVFGFVLFEAIVFTDMYLGWWL